MGGKGKARGLTSAGYYGDLASLLQSQELYEMTRGGRQQFLNAWGEIGQGEMPFGETAFPTMMKAARGPIEEQYGVARESIMENIPAGGRLEEALTDVDIARSQGLQDVVTNYLMDQLNKMYGTAWGMPQISIAGMQGVGQHAVQTGAAAAQAGAQAGSAPCCFNFIEAEGEIHSAVRRYRDEHFTKTGMVAKGYLHTAKYFVPLMRKYKAFKNLIRLTMTRPLKAYAQWYYGENQYGFIFRPIAEGWVNCWRFLGMGVR